MAAGKTTYGKELASELTYNFLDLDDAIEKQTGKTIAAIFTEDGEKKFRTLETEELLKTSSLKNTVIATGGGTACFNNNLDWMKKKGKTIYLKLIEEDLIKRLKVDEETRPIIKDLPEYGLENYVYRTLYQRAYFYNQADVIIQPMLFTAKELAVGLKG